MRHLLVVWRQLKLLSRDATERLHRSLANVLRKNLPETLQRYRLTWSWLRWKKVPCWL
jgi:hypothetical protein